MYYPLNFKEFIFFLEQEKILDLFEFRFKEEKIGLSIRQR